MAQGGWTGAFRLDPTWQAICGLNQRPSPERRLPTRGVSPAALAHAHAWEMGVILRAAGQPEEAERQGQRSDAGRGSHGAENPPLVNGKVFS